MTKTIIVLIALALLITGCSESESTNLEENQEHLPQELTLEEKQEYLAKELELRQIEDIDQELTAILIAEEEVKFCYVKEQNDVVAAHITFLPETNDEAIDRISDKAWQLIEEKYPDKKINVIGSIEE